MVPLNGRNQEQSARAWPSPLPCVGIDGSLSESLGGFLRQTMANAALDQPQGTRVIPTALGRVDGIPDMRF